VARRVARDALVAAWKNPSFRIRDLLSSRDLSRVDRALAREIAYGVERKRLLLDFVLEPLFARRVPDDPLLLAAIRIGAYQLLFLSRIPPHAAVHESVSLAGSRARFVNAVLRRLAQQVVGRAADPAFPTSELELDDGRCLVLSRGLPQDPLLRGALVHGVPRFLAQRWQDRFGVETALRLAEAADVTPAIHLRATSRYKVEALEAMLASAGVQTVPGIHPRTLRWTGGKSPFESDAFRSGAFAVQDPSSVDAAEALGAMPGETIVDLCAAPGTKTMLLGEAVGPSGRVYAFDIDGDRRRRIEENAARLGLDSVVVVSDVDSVPIGDRVLVDAPCSNTGVLARRVEVRHRVAAETFRELSSVQRLLLERAFRLVRRAGTVVYSTCSIEAEENEQVVADVVATSRARLRFERTILPDPPRRDGGYFAVMTPEG
jgi:16S rRNA (cytosine967-C5)-methyltransferase